jgi:hypothetical protein
MVLDVLGGVRFNMRVSFDAKRYTEHSIPVAREPILPEKENLWAGGCEEKYRAVYREKGRRRTCFPVYLSTYVLSYFFI